VTFFRSRYRSDDERTASNIAAHHLMSKILTSDLIEAVPSQFDAEGFDAACVDA
jgi:hypothetical protein